MSLALFLGLLVGAAAAVMVFLFFRGFRYGLSVPLYKELTFAGAAFLTAGVLVYGIVRALVALL